MSSGKQRIQLDDRPTWLGRLGFGQAVPPQAPDAPGIDYRLRARAEERAMRDFVEGVQGYELQGRRAVRVSSRYRIPDGTGLQALVPHWLAHRVRFGVVDDDGVTTYLPVRSVEVSWSPAGTELLLHVAERVAPGTRAFVSARLGRPQGEAPLPPAPGRLGG